MARPEPVHVVCVGMVFGLNAPFSLMRMCFAKLRLCRSQGGAARSARGFCTSEQPQTHVLLRLHMTCTLAQVLSSGLQLKGQMVPCHVPKRLCVEPWLRRGSNTGRRSLDGPATMANMRDDTEEVGRLPHQKQKGPRMLAAAGCVKLYLTMS